MKKESCGLGKLISILMLESGISARGTELRSDSIMKKIDMLFRREQLRIIFRGLLREYKS